MIAYRRPTTPICSPLITTCVVRARAGNVTYRAVDQDELWIGRDLERADIFIGGDPHIARRHARLSRTPAGLTIVDVHSENGTTVGRALRPGESHLLHVGDTISLGESAISFVHELPPAPAHTDEVARLIETICADPDDDDLRLVLADLLTSQGDPRGEFISYQIAAETTVNHEATARADELLALHELAWLAPLPIQVVSWSFRKGLIDCFWVRSGQSVAPLLGRHPFRSIVEV